LSFFAVFPDSNLAASFATASATGLRGGVCGAGEAAIGGGGGGTAADEEVSSAAAAALGAARETATPRMVRM
jgi:hypothetical protein